MNLLLTTSIVAACLLAAVWVGMRIRRSLPDHHLSADSRDTVKLALGLVATMAALVLGLLVSSTKSSYDTTRVQVMQVAARFSLLDRLLAIYGPQANEVRGELHSVMAESIRRIWPMEADSAAPAMPNTQAGNAFYVHLLRLEAGDDTARTLKAQAISQAIELGQVRSLMDAESTSSISKPMLAVVVVWLVMIFFGFSLIAPPNGTTKFALVASTLCAAGAIYLILELDRPFDGLMRISSEPMVHGLSQMGK